MTNREPLSASIRTPQKHSRAIGYSSLLGGCLGLAIVTVACGGSDLNANGRW